MFKLLRSLPPGTPLVFVTKLGQYGCTRATYAERYRQQERDGEGGCKIDPILRCYSLMRNDKQESHDRRDPRPTLGKRPMDVDKGQPIALDASDRGNAVFASDLAKTREDGRSAARLTFWTARMRSRLPPRTPDDVFANWRRQTVVQIRVIQVSLSRNAVQTARLINAFLCRTAGVTGRDRCVIRFVLLRPSCDSSTWRFPMKKRDHVVVLFPTCRAQRWQ